MGAFAYVAITKDGKEKKGSIEARDEERVKAILRDKDLIPISVSEQNIMSRDLDIHIGKAVKLRDLSVFCRQFASILRAGVNVVEALDMLSEQTENKAFRKAIKSVQSSVERGETLSESMAAQKKIFPPLLINMVEAGEASGSLEATFNRMATQFEKSSKLRNKVRSAMIYPVVILIVAIAITIVMAILIVPQFAEIFDELDSDLPGITLAVVAMSEFIIESWYILVIAVLIVIVGIRAFGMTEQGKHVYSLLAIKIPLFGKFNIKNASASFARTLATLVGAGIPISEALDITSRSMKNVLFKKALINAREEVERGISLSEPIRHSGLFPPMIAQMLKIGEETGNIEGMLEKAAEYYEEEVEILADGLTKAMEPLLIVIVGAIVAFMVLALYMPMIGMFEGMENL